MVEARPIPAVFLYEQTGRGITVCIQHFRRETEARKPDSFCGGSAGWSEGEEHERIILESLQSKMSTLPNTLDGKKTTFKDLDDGLVRAFKEYHPSLIDLDDEGTAIDEIINLFMTSINKASR